MGCHFLLQGIFPTQELNLCLPALKADSLATREAPVAQTLPCKHQRGWWMMGEGWEAGPSHAPALSAPKPTPLPMAKVLSSLKRLTYKTAGRTAGGSSLGDRRGRCQLTLTGPQSAGRSPRTAATLLLLVEHITHIFREKPLSQNCTSLCLAGPSKVEWPHGGQSAVPGLALSRVCFMPPRQKSWGCPMVSDAL